MPSITMNPGLDQCRIRPHHAAATVSAGCTVSENALKQTRSRKGCMGTCITLSAREPQRSTSVPWMSECRKSSNESSRKADLESVESVSGRNIRIWRTVESLCGRAGSREVSHRRTRMP